MTEHKSVMTSTEKQDKGLALWLGGETNIAEIARQCGVSRSCVAKWSVRWKASPEIGERAKLARDENVAQMFATLHVSLRLLDEKVLTAHADHYKIKEVVDFLLEVKERGLYDDYPDKMAQLDQAIATLSNCQDISPGELMKIVNGLQDRVTAAEVRAGNAAPEQLTIRFENPTLEAMAK